MVEKGNLILRYGEDNINNLATKQDNSLDDDLLNEMLENAKNIVSSYVGELDHPVLKNHILIIAYYFLEKERATEKARLDYEDTLKFLSDVATGKIKLAGRTNSTGEAGAGNSNISQSGTVIFTNSGSVFKR